MSRKRLVVWAVAVAVALTARLGVAAPRAAMTELRAAACCAEHCPTEPRRPMTPHRCCAVSSPAADPASTTTAGATLATPPAALPVALLPVLPVASDGIAARCDVVPVRAGPPPFLLSLQLRR